MPDDRPHQKVLKYETVASGIRTLIAASLSPNDALPSERDLMATYGVSRMTVRAAIAKLSDEGRIYAIHGSGTFVGAETSFTRTRKLTSFTEDMTDRGLVASSKTLAVARVEASAEVSETLRIPLGTECTHLRRLRLADGNPLAIENVYLPEGVISIDALKLNESLYEQLSALGHQVCRAEEVIRAINLGPADSKLLGVPNGTAALQVERVGSSKRGHLVEFAQTIYRADRYNFRFVVAREPSES